MPRVEPRSDITHLSMAKNMTQHPTRTSEQPFAEKKYLDIYGHKIAYLDEGEAIAEFVRRLRG